MKILQICPIFPPSPLNFGSGVTAVVYHIGKELVRMGHEVTVYTSAALDTHRKMDHVNNPVIIDGIEVYHFPYRFHHYTSFLTLGIIPHMKKNINKFDIIHLHDSRCFQGVVAHHYAKKFGIPYVLQAHGAVLPSFGKQKIKKFFDRFFGYKILQDAAKVIALTKTESQQYEKMGVNENKIKIIPNGIDLSKYNNLPKIGEFRNKYNIGHDEKIILYLGRLHKIKGIDLLVKAFADLTKELDDVRLVIVGPDEGFLSTLKKEITNLKIGDKILFTGPLYERDKLEAFVDADVYVLPSVYETFPITLLEAYACATPAIVTDRCGIANIINNEAGCVVRYNKVQLLKAISAILCDDNLRKRFGLYGEKLVRDRFNWKIIAKNIEEVYLDLIKD